MFCTIQEMMVSAMFSKFDEIQQFFEARKKYGIKPGLERIYQLLALQGHPEKQITAIHIAGTNGKGSTLSYINHALLANNFQVGVFTSPSITGLTGHILKNDKPISEGTFIHIMNELYPNIKRLDEMDMHVTEFEILTVLAFCYFAKEVDIAIIEAGMGGRFDTTNCIHPAVSIITNVALDHQAFLGDTTKEIAYHKAGIIKEHVPVIVGRIDPEAWSVVKGEAKRKNSAIYRIGESFKPQNLKRRDFLQQFVWKSETAMFNVSIPMAGEHQIDNVSLAIQAIVLLIQQGYAIKMPQALSAIEKTVIPGRFELVKRNPYIVVDSAHNPAGIASFLEALNYLPRGRKRHLIFAGFKDKDLQNMLHMCEPFFSTITATSFQHPRAIRAKDLAALLESNHIVVLENWQEALKQICTYPAHDQIFITGSFHFISLVRTYLRKVNKM